MRLLLVATRGVHDGSHRDDDDHGPDRRDQDVQCRDGGLHAEKPGQPQQGTGEHGRENKYDPVASLHESCPFFQKPRPESQGFS